MTTRAVYANAVLHPLEPLDLAEGAQVEVIVRTAGVAVTEAAWTPELAWEAMMEAQELSGEAKGDDAHVARDHDHYLYGAPRRSGSSRTPAIAMEGDEHHLAFVQWLNVSEPNRKTSA